MTNALKGALLSGLVLPGLGQMLLKRYMRGLAFIAVVVGGLAVMVLKASQLAYSIVEKMELDSRGMDMQTITDAATRAAATSDNRSFNLCLGLIIVTWLFSIVDAYVIGRKMDARQIADESTEQPL
jgi:TM2 domain-containing membrane protein YozV